MSHSALQTVVDFFEGRGQFGARADYVGMDASAIPELFVEFFEQQSTDEQRALAQSIASIALGRTTDLADYVPAAARLMVDLAVRGHAAAFAGVQPALEQELTNSKNLERWSAASDTQPGGGLAFRADWHYPLQLWGVLYLLGSPGAAEAFDYLEQHAHSERFRQALILARGVYDRKR